MLTRLSFFLLRMSSPHVYIDPKMKNEKINERENDEKTKNENGTEGSTDRERGEKIERASTYSHHQCCWQSQSVNPDHKMALLSPSKHLEPKTSGPIG